MNISQNIGATTAAAVRPLHIAICASIYNDWQSALVLLARLDAVARRAQHTLDVLFIDDGSSDEVPAALHDAPAHLARVSVLRLRRNLGHQRAIAIGLAYLYDQEAHDAVVVMDGDGEDRPEDIPLLIERCGNHGWSRVIFAERTRRAEGAAFRLGYAGYKLLHRALVGRGIGVGNFSVIPRCALARLISVSEMWNHYAASVYQARIPLDVVPTARGARIAGQSKMNWIALVMHGLSAISVYSHIVGVRLLVLMALAIFGILLALAGVVAVKLGTTLAIPGWATTAAGILLVSLLNLVVLSTLLSLFALHQRSEHGFLPLRDYPHFVLDQRVWHASRS
jgi:polyisoprenyl-phosphate glycosyltransferase